MRRPIRIGVTGTHYYGAMGAAPVMDLVCKDKAQKALASVDARTMQLIAEYWPPARVEWPDVKKTLFGLVDMGKIATDLIGEARKSYSTDYLRASELTIYNTINANEILGDQAPMNGAAYKDWVVRSMFAISAGMKAVIQSQCEKPWYVTFFQWYQPKFDYVWDIMAELGDGIQKAPKVLANIWMVVKWGSIAVGAYWLYTKLPKKK